eukprot:PRCOL_00006790-RA
MSQQMSVADLPPQQLQRLAEQLNQETSALQDSYQQMGGVKGKFEASSRAVDRLTKQEDGAEILVPLTESLYVPAQLATSESLMVDIGTGYYVDKSTAGAKDYCARKAKMLDDNMAKLRGQLSQRRQNLEVVNQVFHQKMAAMEQAAKEQEAKQGI